MITDQTFQGPRYPDVITQYKPGKIEHVKKFQTSIIFICNNRVILSIHFLNECILRFRFGIDGEFPPDFSYAIDQNFQPEDVTYQLEETASEYIIHTKLLDCGVGKKSLLIRISDKQGTVICQDHNGFSWKESIMKGICDLRVSKKYLKNEKFYGLGDKACSMNLSGKAFENWGVDAFAYVTGSDPLYRNIPFYYSLMNGIGYGIFLDNSYRTRFDFGKSIPGETGLAADGGEMNYYFIYGPALMDVAKRYVSLTGKPELPALWTLGYHQCKWSYFPEQKVLDIARQFREREIPCDTIWLDIDYMDGYRCFTWDRERFPDPAGMVRELKSMGFKNIVMIDPGIKVDHNYHVHKEAIEKEYFCKRADGTLMKGPVWPEHCHFPDFTNPEVRTWWGALYHDLILNKGINGVWNDMNEPAVFKIEHKTFPDDVLHHYEGHPCSHKKAHNIYGMQMSRATYEGIKELNPRKRPFVLTRSSFSGGQRYAAAWTGDNIASWEHLHLANIQCQRMSVSGFSFVGSDIGGFANTPDGELFIRWLQLGIFHPLCRTHTMGHNVDGAAPGDKQMIAGKVKFNPDVNQEPWSFGEKYTEMAKNVIALRYKLLPYLYTAFWQYVTDGTPIIKPLSFYDQHDPNTHEREDEFLFGQDILISPVVEQGARKKEVYLPKGEWYNYWSREVISGQQKIMVNAPLEYIPIFIKAGAVIPFYPVMQYVDEQNIQELDLYIYYKSGQSNSFLYEDAHEGYEYMYGRASISNFIINGDNHTITIIQQKKGGFVPPYDKYKMTFHGLPFEAKKVIIDGKDTAKKGEDILEITVEAGFKELTITSNQ